MSHSSGAFVILFTLLAAGAPATRGAATFVAQAPTQSTPACPAGYIPVPAMAGYTAFNFCVAKYEMKDAGGMAKSEAAGTPWVNISRDSALAACQAAGAGYDLVSLDQWQTIARNIADTAANWSSGTPYVGELNTGHSDGSPNGTLAADNKDDNACAGTGETCSSTVWNSQRRTHVLSNGSAIWDMAGNVWDLVRDDNFTSRGAAGFISTFNSGDDRQTKFGNDQFCAGAGSPPHCGFGWGYMDNSMGSIRRGGDADTVNGNVYGAGIFATNLNFPTNYPQSIMGFRCSFQP